MCQEQAGRTPNWGLQEQNDALGARTKQSKHEVQWSYMFRKTLSALAQVDFEPTRRTSPWSLYGYSRYYLKQLGIFSIFIVFYSSVKTMWKEQKSAPRVLLPESADLWSFTVIFSLLLDPAHNFEHFDSLSLCSKCTKSQPQLILSNYCALPAQHQTPDRVST